MRRAWCGRVPPLVDRFAGFRSATSSALGGTPLRRRGHRALLVRAVPGAACRRSARAPCSICTTSSRVLHARCAADGRPRRAHLPIVSSSDASRELERAWLPRFSQVLAASRERCRTGARASRPARTVAVYPNALPLPPRPPRRRRGGRSSSPATWSTIPTVSAVRFFRQRDLAAAARPLAAAGLAAGGQESRSRVAQFTRGDPRIEVVGPVDDAVRELARARVAVVPLLVRQRYPPEDSGGMGGRAAGSFYHIGRRRPAGA